MYTRDSSTRIVGLVVTTAMAGVLLAGCASPQTGGADLTAGQAKVAEQASVDRKTQRAITMAENAVIAAPNNAEHRAKLGAAYLDAGRFASAATSFDDAMKLGDSSARTALSGALALTGGGKLAEAAALLNANEGKIAKADLGLAVSLAGQPARGIHIMSNAIRGGENTVKMRQNLAYAYALDNRWREARLMAEQDVPAGMVSDRIESWAATVHPEAYQYRVAKLLQVPGTVSDAGQPVQLALNAPSSAPVAMAAKAVSAPKPAARLASAELPPVTLKADPAPYKVRPTAAKAEQPADFDSAFAAAQPLKAQAPAPEAKALQPVNIAASSAAPKVPMAPRYSEISRAEKPALAPKTVRARPVPASLAPAPKKPAAAPIAQASKAAAPRVAASGSHLVQLGSFTSEQRARKAWDIYLSRYPELKNHKMVISQAKVHGRNYWRVSAGDFAKVDSSKMCGKVKASGKGCLTWAANAPLPGALATGVRLARR